MKKAILFCMVLLTILAGGCSAPAAQVTSTPAAPTAAPTAVTPTQTPAPTPTAEPTEPPSRVQVLTIPAPSLANNLLGDTAEREITVYLPPSYFVSDTRYPVVYFLPGYQETSISIALPNDLDDAVAKGKSREIIFVIAAGNNSLQGSFYVNSPVTGNWEDFILKDGVGYIDANYRTQASAGSRAITGFSMGGFGSLNLAMKYPDVFGMVFSMSPGLFDEKGLAESQMFSVDTLPALYLEKAAEVSTLGQKEAVTSIKNSSQIFTFAYGAAFSPDPTGKPPYIKYPYQNVNGKQVRDDAAWKVWEGGYGGIKEEIAQYKDNWLKLKGIGLNYGTGDNYAWIPKGCTYFAKEMQAAGIPVEVTTYAGGHEGYMRSRVVDEMLPFLSERFE
jgi:S-formylglutathione hydrolase